MVTAQHMDQHECVRVPVLDKPVLTACEKVVRARHPSERRHWLGVSIERAMQIAKVKAPELQALVSRDGGGDLAVGRGTNAKDLRCA
eukprot:scaffold242289_cov31-Tisochrysis_lutea.AAC.3